MPTRMKASPERCGDVGADAGEQMHAADPMQAARGEDGHVLQIALAPAAVADGEVGQRRRAFLVAAGQTRYHVDGPAARGASGRPPRNHG